MFGTATAAPRTPQQDSVAATAASPPQRTHKLLAPTWIPIRKADLSSWRAGPVVEPPTANGLEGAPRPTDIFLVRCAQGTLSAVQAAASNDSGLRVVEIAAPRTIAKSGSTPDAGPTAPLAFECTPLPHEPDPSGDGEDGAMPAMELPPTISDSLMETCALQCIVTLDQAAANAAANKIRATCDNAAVDVVTIKYPPTCTCIIKGIPLSVKQERLWQELESLQSAKPSYMRFFRNDRGLFKNVVYVKFRTPVDAALGKLEMERLAVGARPLKVEVKKLRMPSGEDAARLEAARREDLKVLLTASLEQSVKDLLKSTENEGFSYPKGSLSKEDQKFLKGICQVHDCTFETTMSSHVVKKKIVVKSVSPSMGPARTPPFHPSTPSTHAADAADATGLQFRGIRHWREQRSGGQGGLGLHRSLGPSDGVQPWHPGRGKPLH